MKKIVLGITLVMLVVLVTGCGKSSDTSVSSKDDTSSSENFINTINPKYSVISVGENNRFGHPKEETLYTLRNSKIYAISSHKFSTNSQNSAVKSVS